jgi:hypothetical protein
MAEQIIINIARPDVGIEYRPESNEAELADRLAACELALHALAQHVRELRGMLGLSCPDVVENLAVSDTWRHGM